MPDGVNSHAARVYNTILTGHVNLKADSTPALKRVSAALSALTRRAIAQRAELIIAAYHARAAALGLLAEPERQSGK